MADRTGGDEFHLGQIFRRDGLRVQETDAGGIDPEPVVGGVEQSRILLFTQQLVVFVVVEPHRAAVELSEPDQNRI